MPARSSSARRTTPARPTGRAPGWARWRCGSATTPSTPAPGRTCRCGSTRLLDLGRGRRRRRRDGAHRDQAGAGQPAGRRSPSSPRPARSRSCWAATTPSRMPDITGLAEHFGYGRISVMHFDAHADTGDIQFGSLYGHGLPMRRVIESGAVRGDRFLQIGLRGYWPEPPELLWMAEQRHARLRDGRDPAARPGRGDHRGAGDRGGRHRRGVPVGGHRRRRPRARRPAPAPRSPAG